MAARCYTGVDQSSGLTWQRVWMVGNFFVLVLFFLAFSYFHPVIKERKP